jgi:hypothetical protein
MDEAYARELITSFPYPIASAFVRLRTDECLDPGPLRLKHTLATGEAIARFLGIIVLCDVREQIEATGTLPQTLAADFIPAFKRPSWGVWLRIVREGLQWLDRSAGSISCRELLALMASEAQRTAPAQALARLLAIRNDLTHERIKAMHLAEYRVLCDETYDALAQVLEALRFLLDYELSFVSQIEVCRRRHRQAQFVHRFKAIDGHSEDFAGQRATLASFMDSRAIIWRRRGEHAYLSLDPLLLYEEAAGKAPDIFYYESMRSPETATYVACRHGGSFNSADASRGLEIAEELAALLEPFRGPEVQAHAG